MYLFFDYVGLRAFLIGLSLRLYLKISHDERVLCQSYLPFVVWHLKQGKEEQGLYQDQK